MVLETVKYRVTFVVLGACLLCVSLPVEAHGNLFPSWAGPVILVYVLSFPLLFVASVCAALDVGTARWLRVAVPLSMVAMLVLCYGIVRNHHTAPNQASEAFV